MQEENNQRQLITLTTAISGFSLVIGMLTFTFVVLPAAGTTAQSYLQYMSDKAWLVQFLYATQIIATLTGFIAIITLYLLVAKTFKALVLTAAIATIFGLVLNGGITDTAIIAFIPLSRMYLAGGELGQSAVAIFTALNTYQAALNQSGALFQAIGVTIFGIWFKAFSKNFTFLGLPSIFAAMGMLPFGLFGTGWPQSVLMSTLAWAFWLCWVGLRLRANASDT